MEVYRIAKENNIYDLSGAGARRFGGRWNLEGTSVIYTSESRALASLEYLVHVPITLTPSGLKIAVVHVPDEIKPKEVSISELPYNWRDYPAPHGLAKLGSNWVKSKKTLLLRVPSALVLNEYNILINPAHENFKLIEVRSAEDFKYDNRLLE